MTARTAPARDTPAGAGAPPPVTLRRKPAGALYVWEVAARAGVAAKTVEQYHYQAERRREAGQPRPRDMPEPDGYEPQPRGGKPRPWWYPRTVKPWLAARHGPGRPPKEGGKPRVHVVIRQRPGPKPRTPIHTD